MFQSIYWRRSEPHFNIKTIFLDMVISMLKIRRSLDRLIFNTGIPILERWHLYIVTAPCWHIRYHCDCHFHMIQHSVSSRNHDGWLLQSVTQTLTLTVWPVLLTILHWHCNWVNCWFIGKCFIILIMHKRHHLCEPQVSPMLLVADISYTILFI